MSYHDNALILVDNEMGKGTTFSIKLDIMYVHSTPSLFTKSVNYSLQAQIPIIAKMTYFQTLNVSGIIFSILSLSYNLITMKLYIKHMVSARCRMTVRDELKKLGLHYV